MDNFINPDLRNAPATPPPLTFEAEFNYDGALLELKTYVMSPFPLNDNASLVNPVPQAAVVIPAVSVQVSPGAGILSPDRKQVSIATIVRSNLPRVEGALELLLPGSHFVALPSSKDISLIHAGDSTATTFNLQFPNDTYPDGSSVYQHGVKLDVHATAFVGGRTIHEGYKSLGYPGLPYTNFYTPATYRVTAVDLNIAPNLRIAYLSGTGDTVPDFLSDLGITPTLLTTNDLTLENLRQYDAVVLGVRAYAAHTALAGPGSKPLLEYARQGGTVILQYMTARFGDADAPFPITVPGDPAHNVVEEADPVTLLDEKSPLLTWPNKITAADFDHWVAERGHGFAAHWSPEYQPLLETHDPDQEPQQGGLLYARIGKGAYVYCAFALYRQLPEGVPGAYRLLANLLSLGKNPNITR